VIVPWFRQGREPDRNQVLAIDLETGVPTRVSFEEIDGQRYELSSILQWQGQTFLVLVRPLGSSAEPGWTIREYKPRFGATGRVCELPRSQDLIGVEPNSRVELEAPLVFLQSTADGDRELRIHALQLPYGHQRWVQRVPIPRDSLYTTRLPAPAVGDTRVAVLFTRSSGQGDPTTELHCFDRLDGSPDGNQILSKSLDRGRGVTLIPLGDALLIAGPESLQVMR
jgi:hypothetical protein